MTEPYSRTAPWTVRPRRLDQQHSILSEEAVAKLFAEYYPQNGYGWFLGSRFGAILRAG